MMLHIFAAYLEIGAKIYLSLQKSYEIGRAPLEKRGVCRHIFFITILMASVLAKSSSNLVKTGPNLCGAVTGIRKGFFGKEAR